ncbi:integrase, catalytic region, zinc finger, CCHC-type containing protein [Tanacetum coccineum]|uniref:Integrase, catalytic region, zinc finger, CCHC-type containing protein n=1 Tax=Tanacetum coccineum TaxID=301880 RepID=A0ABQ4YRQ5_9ASTR
MEKLENENVSLEFQVQSLIKERDNVKLEYQKLFDSIKKTRSQSQKEMDELIEHVSEKTYAYGAIRAENQNLLSTISELQTRLETVEKVLKTRFSEKLTQSKSLDTTSVVSKPKIDLGSISKAKHKVVQIVLWIIDSGCSKHGRCLRHNLFSVGQFCDGDLEVAFRSKTCYVRNLEGDAFLTGGCESNLYTISISNMAAFSPVFLISKSTLTKSWLWHRRLSHLNFAKKSESSNPPKLVPSDHSKLKLLHMDLCGPMRVASINGKKYILVIVDDYSGYTWVYFLYSKDKTPEIIKKFIAQTQLNYKAKVCKIRIDNGGIINTPSKEDLDNLFGPMFEEYFKKRSFDTPINSAAQSTQFHKDSPSTSSIIVDEHKAPPIETTSDEQTSPIYLTDADEFNQEDSADFNGNLDFVPYNTPIHEEIESSTEALEPSNVQNFHKARKGKKAAHLILTESFATVLVPEEEDADNRKKVDTSKALDDSLVDTKSSGIESKEQDTSSRSGNDVHADDADIRPIYDEEPMAEVQTTSKINVFATGQQHIEPTLN